ncbi:ABC transporter substrate-binding protein, partial [Hansschlegelia beijingensis]
GLQKAAKYYYTTGWHEPNNVTELTINQAAWDSLPDDLKAVVRSAATTCNLISHTWCEATNAEALDDLVKNQGVIAGPLPKDVVEGLRATTKKTLDGLAASDPKIKKVYDAFLAFKEKHDRWAGVSEAVYQGQIRVGGV